MDRALSILTGGWLDTAITVETFGYYGYTIEGEPTVCLTLQDRSLNLTLSNRYLDLHLLSRSLGVTLEDRDTLVTLYNRYLALTVMRRKNC